MLDKIKKMFNKNHVPASVSKEPGTDAKAEADAERPALVDLEEVG